MEKMQRRLEVMFTDMIRLFYDEKIGNLIVFNPEKRTMSMEYDEGL